MSDVEDEEGWYWPDNVCKEVKQSGLAILRSYCKQCIIALQSCGRSCK